jgi:hypothetical protein
MSLIKLRISPAIANEWAVRCIGDVIYGIPDYPYNGGFISVSAEVAKNILADCAYYTDKDGPDTTAAERRAYLALAGQCSKGLGL